MTVTQVLGAKVQPTVAKPIEWNDTRTYEPLTYVMHEGDTYITDRYVPIGIALDNEAYWTRCASFSGQIEGYREEVKTFDNRVAENTNNISKLSSRLDDAPYSVNNILNANIAWQQIYDNAKSLQGCTVFSYSGDYSFESNDMYMACVFTGADDNKDAVVNIYNPIGILISSIGIGDGHFGNLSFNGINKLYTLNYTSETANYGKLFEIDVTNVNAPYISNTYTTNGNPYTYNFWHNGKMCVGYASPVNVIHLFDWDLESDTYTKLNDLVFPDYNNRMHVTQHVSFDESKQCFILSGYSPNGIIVYDKNCKFIKSIGIAEILNDTTVGEIESFVSHNGHFWFASSHVAYNYGATQRRAKYFYYNVDENVLLARTNYSLSYSSIVDFTNGSDRNTSYSNNVPVFKYFDDAVNFSRRNNNNSANKVITVNDYPYVCVANEYAGNIVINTTNCTGIVAINSVGAISCKLNNNGELLISDKKCFIYLLHSTMYLDITFDAEIGDLDYFVYANKCVLTARNPTYLNLICSYLNAGNISNCNVTQHSIAFVMAQADCTYSTSGYVVMNTK